jgi:hypothetical protein
MEIFYKNKIHVDEIISVGAFSQDEFFGSDENNNKEIYVNVKEYLKELHIPNTKKIFIDYTEQFKNPYFFNLINNKKEYWYLDLGCWKSFHNLFWKDLKKHVITDNKKTCFIMGTGKTYLQFDNIGPHVIFTETDTTDYGFNYQDENLFRENFYWGNTNIAAEVVKKQAYIMLDIYNRMIDKKMFVMNYVKIYDKVIYRHCKPLFMPTRKSTGHLLSIRDEFMKKKTNSDIYKYYIRGLQQMSCDIGLKNKTHTTKKYYLKNV